ncbi:MAG: abortive infection family protein [Spirochaetaceae bacterium]|nr:abortive infection family protein [Spirochaetaceae bacterium]
MANNKLDSQFELLRNKQIITILDGDTNFGEIKNEDGGAPITVSMPYLSGPTICEISNTFGLPASYGWNGGAQSRWAYFDDLLKYCIDNKNMTKFLSYLFSKEQFVDKLKGMSPITIERAHRKIIETVITKINGILYFGGNEIITSGAQFIIRKIGSNITVETPTVKKIDRDYIKSLSERAMRDILESNFDSAITKSRTLLEEIFCYVIEKKGEEPSDSGDIGKLYNQVKTLYNMHQNKDIDKRINMLLSGLEKIISSIAQMRNEGSDSHGLGNKRINILEYHARLYVNAAITMGDFILSVGEKNLNSKNDF